MIIFGIIVAIILTIMFLAIILFLSHINNILYNFKLDVYSIAKTGIIAVNKNKANTGAFSYDTKSYQNEIVKVLRDSYNLDSELSNDEKLISKITIKEFKIYRKNQKDTYTKQKCYGETLHIVMDVKVRPIVFAEYLKDIFVFEIHEDVSMNTVKM